MEGRVQKWHEWMGSSTDFPLLLDGSIGDLLKERRHQFEKPTVWAASLLRDNRDVLRQLAMEYLESGADILTTATYQATARVICKEFGINQASACTMLRSATEVLHEVREMFWRRQAERGQRRYPAIAASIGPLASWMEGESEYRGTYANVTHDAFVDEHRDMVEALTGGELQPDIVAFETIPSGREAQAIVEVMNLYGRSVPYWLCLQCTKDQDSGEWQLADGSKLEPVVRAAVSEAGENLVCIGVNCVSPELGVALGPMLRQLAPKMSSVVYANGYESLGQDARQWAETQMAHKTTIVGGCCGTSVSHIAALRDVRNRIGKNV